MRRIVLLTSIVLLGLMIGVVLAFTLYKQWVYRNAQPVLFLESSSSHVIYSMEIVKQMLAEIKPDRALVDLRSLTGETPVCLNSECYSINNRLTGSEGLHWAKAYVYENLVNLSYSVELQDWSHSGDADQNIIARKTGSLHPEESVYFVAHLDGASFSPAADDNASGAVDLLELARVLSKYTFSRTLILLWTTGEEQSSFGVRNYIEHLTPSELNAIQYVVNIDMIGYDANQDGVMELWHAGHSPSLELA